MNPIPAASTATVTSVSVIGSQRRRGWLAKTDPWYAGAWYAGAWYAGAWYAGAWYAGAWYADARPCPYDWEIGGVATGETGTADIGTGAAETGGGALGMDAAGRMTRVASGGIGAAGAGRAGAAAGAGAGACTAADATARAGEEADSAPLASQAAPRATACFGVGVDGHRTAEFCPTSWETMGIRDDPPTSRTEWSCSGAIFADSRARLSAAIDAVHRWPYHRLQLGPGQPDVCGQVGQ